MNLNWTSREYFATLICRDDRANAALEMLVDDLHAAKERTIRAFLCHSGSEDFLWGLVRLLGSDNARVAGNAAYIIGTVAENELGCVRIIAMTASCSPRCNTILVDLTNMLAFDDSESMMNAAGTIGTLAESADGREWMLKEDCLNLTISHITDLLNSDNLWTSSNAALVLARLTISEEGCLRILNHDKSANVLTMLIASLGADEAGRGMNAAFAIGRLCDMEASRNRLLKMPECDKMISSMGVMLSCCDAGTSKNACFALSCLAMNKDGHMRLLKNSHTDAILRSLSELISAEDAETAWFAAMTLRTLAAQPKGCLRLRSHQTVIPALKAIECRSEEISCDLRDEVLQTLEILKRLDKPSAPSVKVSEQHEMDIRWEESTTKCNFEVTYHLYEGSRHVYYGKELCFTITNLEPCTQYCFKLRASTEGDDSPFSDSVTAETEENVPGPPENVTVLAFTMTQLKIGWQPPLKTNGVLKGYYIYNGKAMVEHTSELNAIISGLHASTTYEIQVCAATAKGKGKRASVEGATSDQGAHAPSKPDVYVLGRKELQVSWKPPEVPLGRISRYDVSVNGEVIYSGTDLYHVARRLKPDTEYVFMVTVITNEGRCDSKVTRKRTARDEYEGDRAPLYPPPASKRDTGEGTGHKGKETETPSVRTSQKKRRSIDGIPNHGHQGVDGVGRFKALAARSASATGVKAKAAAHGGFAQSKSDTKLTTSTPTGQSNNTRTTVKPHHESGDSARTEREARPEREALLETAEPDILDVQEEANEPQRIAVIPLKRCSPPTPSTELTNDRLDIPIAIAPPKDPTPATHHDNHLQVFAANTDRTPIPAPRSSRNNTNAPPERTRFSRVSRSLDLTDIGFNVAGARKAGMNGYDERRKGSLNEGALAEDSKQDELYHVDSVDPAWIAVAKSARSRSNSITRSLTALQMSMTELAPLLSKSTILSEVAQTMFPNVSKSNMPPTYLQRAKTFTASHRPTVRKRRDSLSEMVPKSVGSGPGQWQPDFPSPSQRENRHNKFVPMQLRTQPMNLPGSPKPTATDKGIWTPLEIGMTRSRTSLTPSASDTHLDSAIGDTASEFTLSSHRQLTRRGSAHGPLRLMKEAKLNVHTFNSQSDSNDAMSSEFSAELIPSGGNLQNGR